MSAISVRNVWLEYGDVVVLEHIDLQIASGAFVSVVGPSGAGKSTFLRLILGQEQPTQGEILLDGAPLPPEPGPDRGVVHQGSLRSWHAGGDARPPAPRSAGAGAVRRHHHL